MAAAGNGRTGGTGFSVDICTPFSWIAQKSSWAAKRYQKLRLEDVTGADREGILRVYANPDMPTRVISDSMIGTSGVEHLITRSTLDKKGEFFVVVIGTSGEEKKFKIKTKHFERLP